MGVEIQHNIGNSVAFTRLSIGVQREDSLYYGGFLWVDS